MDDPFNFADDFFNKMMYVPNEDNMGDMDADVDEVCIILEIYLSRK